MSSDRELIYIADPMCSWCYGFAPVIQGIHAKFQDRLNFRLVVGGLRVGTQHVLGADQKETIAGHWHEVHKETGQPFNFDFAVPDDFRYDTEPSCRATVVMRRAKPEEALPFFDTLHHAFYAENRDLTKTDILAELAAKHGLDNETFAKEFEEDEVKQETWDDFAFGQSLGIRGFPSVILSDQRGMALLTSGYQKYEDILPALEDWLG